MSASKQLQAPEPEEDAPVALTVEERKRRVEAVRGLDRELEQIENSLLAAAARLPALVREVAQVRKTIRENTAVSPLAEEEA